MIEESYQTCYTIGHSNYDIEYFLGLLEKHSIGYIVDVRSNPYSKYAPHFNKDSLSQALHDAGLTYVFMGDLLGARYTDDSLLFDVKDGVRGVDLEKVAQTESFKKGIQRVIDGLSKKLSIALMCSEKNPLDCHRFTLIAYHLHKKGVQVEHILEDGQIASNESMEKKLLEAYINNTSKKYDKIRSLLSHTNDIFSSQTRTSEENEREAIGLSYASRTREICYKPTDDSVAQEN